MAKTRKNTVSYLLLDVKGAFDHVSIHQLIQIMKSLHLPNPVILQTKSFLQNRAISLAFDGKKQQLRYILTGIPQGSPISLILFLIYIRFLFPGLKAAVPEVAATVPSFIDDVAIYIESKTVANNIELLTKIV